MPINTGLMVQGNIPCPAPPPHKTPNGQGGAPKVAKVPDPRLDNPYSRPVPFKLTTPRINNEEDLRNVMRLAKKPAQGVNQAAARKQFIKRMKVINDKIFLPTWPAENDSGPVMVITGRTFHAKSEVSLPLERFEGEQTGEHDKRRVGSSVNFAAGEGVTLDALHMSSGAHPDHSSRRGPRYTHSVQSAVSIKSGRSIKSEPGRPMVLPLLTIGSKTTKTLGDYMSDSPDFDISSEQAPHMTSSNSHHQTAVLDLDYRLLMMSPRRFPFHKSNALFSEEKAESIRNYESLTISDLKACFHVKRPTQVSTGSDILRRYLNQFHKSQSSLDSRNKRNPYKRYRPAGTVAPVPCEENEASPNSESAASVIQYRYMTAPVLQHQHKSVKFTEQTASSGEIPDHAPHYKVPRNDPPLMVIRKATMNAKVSSLDDSTPPSHEVEEEYEKESGKYTVYIPSK